MRCTYTIWEFSLFRCPFHVYLSVGSEPPSTGSVGSAPLSLSWPIPFVVWHVAVGGSIGEVEQVASRFTKDAVIVFEDPSAIELLAPPLKLIHGLETLVMGPPGV